MKEVCREMCLSEQTYCRLRKECGGMQVSLAKRVRSLEKEDQHLTGVVAKLTVADLILEEASKGNS